MTYRSSNYSKFDIMTPAQRKRCMSRIRGKDTGPELFLRKALWKAGFRYRLYSKLPGKPDLIFKGRHVAVFVDGCFWHGCPKHATQPKGNEAFWKRKLGGNIERDKINTQVLEAHGWRVLRFWEHQVMSEIDIVIETISSEVKKDPS